MTDSFLRRIFPNDVHHVAGLHEAVRGAVPTRGRILDLGCGANTDLESYHTADCEVWGTDFQAHPELRHAERFRLLKPDGAIPFADSHFDTVVSIMVLEHVADPGAFLGEVARVLRPGGRFIGHTISGSHYVTGLRRLFGLMPHSVSQKMVKKLYGRDEVDTFPAYYRMNTESRVRRFCTAAGLNLAAVRRYADPGYFRFARPLEAAAILTDRALEMLCPGWGRLYLTLTVEKPRGADTDRRAA